MAEKKQNNRERFPTPLYADNDSLRAHFLKNKVKDTSKDMFSSLIENSKYPVLVMCEVNGSRKIIDTSCQLAEILGYSRTEISYSSDEIIVECSDPDSGNFSEVKRNAENGRSRSRKLVLRKKNGDELSFIATISIIKAEGSKFFVLYINQDNSKNNILEVNPETIPYAPYIRNIIEYCVDGIVITDANGDIAVVNSATEKIFGYSREVLSKQKIVDFIPQERKYFIEGAKMVEQLMTDGIVKPFESAIVNKSTEVVPVEWTISYFYDESGNIAGSVGVCRDLRERKMLEYQVLQSNKLAALGQLAAGIAHEINNPLAGIVGYAQYLIKKMGEKTEKGLNAEELSFYLEKLEKIEIEAQKSKYIIQNLLKFSRGNDVFKMEPIDLNQVIENTIDIVGNNVLLNNIKIEKLFKKDLAKIKGNSFQLEQVFTNFIINACQAMPDSGLLTLMTGHIPNKSGKAESVYAVVSDTGEGIEKGYLTKIFDPFFTTKRPGSGTGLGLSVSYGIIRQHEGEIEVLSEKDCGTGFFLSFPVYQE